MILLYQNFFYTNRYQGRVTGADSSREGQKRQWMMGKQSNSTYYRALGFLLSNYLYVLENCSKGYLSQYMHIKIF